jgi:hypothetical protein
MYYKIDHNVFECNSFDEIPLNATSINCSNSKLSVLPDLTKYEKLLNLYCYNNYLTFLPDFNLPNLQTIDCYHNLLTELPEFNKCKSLEIIDFSYNKLKTFPQLNECKNLQYIGCSNNFLTFLPDFKLSNLWTINCSHNFITIFPEFLYLNSLRSIYCFYNKLTCLPEFQNSLHLETICCSNNNLTYLPTWIHLLNLHTLSYFNNQIEYISPNILRIIQRRNNSQYNNIYNDSQNVHNHNIQICLRKSIQYLLVNKPTISYDEMIDEMKTQVICINILLEYLRDESIHSILNITFGDILIAVWCKIRDHKDKEEIIKILNIEMLDAECKCFTGKITRLVNCLNHFDENIVLQIDENEQMSNISRILYEKYPILSDYQRELRNEFLERGYSEEQIKIWSNIE